MNDDSQEAEVERTVGRLFVPSLVLSRFSTVPVGLILGLLLIEIGQAFGVPVGMAGQLSTARSVAAVLASLLMGFLTVKYNNKHLLMTGLLVLGISTLGLYLAPSFILFMVFSVLVGLGVAMVMPMTTTLVAEHMPVERRAGAIGVLMATISFSMFISTPVIRYVAGIGGWRLPYLVYALPLPFLTLLVIFRGLPSVSGGNPGSVSSVSLVDGYKGVLSKLSANVCLLCNSLSAATFAGINTYSISFYRQNFSISLNFATIFVILAAFFYTVGALISGKLVNRFGRKRLTSVTALLCGVFIFFFSIAPNLWVSMALTLTACLLAGVRASSHVNLTLEQVPEYRGTIMSLSAASVNLGSALGSGVGGAALLWFGYRAVGPSLGLLGVISAILLYRFVVDTAEA